MPTRGRRWRQGDLPVVIALVAVSLLLMGLGDTARRESARVLHSFVYYPVEKAIAVVGNLATMREDYRRLQMKTARLAAENARLTEAALENARLREAIGFRSQVTDSLIPAEVIGHTGGLSEPILIVDVGEESGVRAGLPVVCPDGVVGRVLEVGPRMSWVMLLTHPDCRVSAVVQRSRIQGIVEYRPGQGLVLGFLPVQADVAPGDLVVTSGLGGVFPAGWPIGEAIHMREEFGGLLWQVQLRPGVDFHRLEEVFILRPAAERPAAGGEGKP